ncbi:MAG: response regulator [Peptostreptococcales bacterium]
MSEYQVNKISVAIVEDDPMVRRITEEFLQRVEGYICIGSYASLNDAIHGISENKPDLIFLDLFFPKGSGMDLMKWIRESELDIDVLFITADHSSNSIERALRYGAVGYLVKPFRFNRFEDALKKYKKMKEELINETIANQTKIDNLMNWSNPDSVMDSTGYSSVDSKEEHNTTYDRLLTFLKKHNKESFTASMLGDRIGVSRITARRYLDQMEKEGIIELQMLYGSIGRPQNYYQYKTKDDINE